MPDPIGDSDHTATVLAQVAQAAQDYLVYAGKVAFRPAITNWRTTEPDVDLILPVTRELATRLAAEPAARR